MTNAGAAADTIYALSSGSPPAAVALVRISGPRAHPALEALTGRRPEPRRATLVTVQGADGERLDTALALLFPGPASATGEDVAELHLHGGRAVVAAVLAALSRIEGLREARPGEFTRRAFEHGRIDLAEAEGLADLLEAETESQRRSALAMAGGAVGRMIEPWRERLLDLAAGLEAMIDFSDEGEVGDSPPAGWRQALEALAAEIRAALARPPAERLRDGVRIVIAGPPNVGKSSLLNYLSGREAAITSAVAGTTRDVVEAPTAIGGTPFLLVDTAGLRDSADEVESIGVERARDRLATADLVLWLGPPADCPAGRETLFVQSRIDIVSRDPAAQLHVSAVTGEGMGALEEAIVEAARSILPGEGEVALNRRQRDSLGEAAAALEGARSQSDILLAAESLRAARLALDRITGRAGVEDMLDALFGRFCVGK
jgi:tRNA modification GTPase